MPSLSYLNQESMEWQYYHGRPELPEVARLRLAMEHSRARMAAEEDQDKKETLYKHVLMCYRTYNRLKQMEIVR